MGESHKIYNLIASIFINEQEWKSIQFWLKTSNVFIYEQRQITAQTNWKEQFIECKGDRFVILVLIEIWMRTEKMD